MSQTSHFTKVNRRDLLSAGAALIGAAATGLAFEPKASAEKPSTGATHTEPSATAPNYAPPIVQIQGGQLRGYRDGKTTVFLGIPYATAERFELPKPVPPWQGIKSAQSWGPVCPIPPMAHVGIDEFVFPHRYWVEDEHCQILNIWTQSTSASAKKPVMVWLHGGGFTNGSAMEAYAYDGKNLSEFGDVVVVSLNHRLNILGTLDLSAYGPEYAQSRYTGTADILAALQWVQANIAQFGGDPGSVTLFGQSGGGSKAARMLHTPSAKGLFHKVVTQSGGGEVLADQDPAALLKIQQQIAAQTLANLNLTGSDISKLKTIPYLDLITAGQAALRSVAQANNQRAGWNVIADDNYILRQFCDWSSDIPQMSGSVFSEMSSNYVKSIDKNSWTPQQVNEHLTAEFGDKKDAIAAAFKTSFPRKQVQDVLFFARPNTRALAAKAQAGHASVYNYLFVYEYPVNGGTTSFHTAEIAFVFHNLTEPQVRVATGDASEGYALQDKVSRAWINFAYTGNPSQPGLDWKPFSDADPQTMVFDTVSECRNIHAKELIALLPPPPAPRF
ncbi:carboxylesterase/lipase family protein [Terracidiphilus gabretensis]|uniref:carboxylesterase/lipase family protein n=1 Tax=Terracidiphilus gabretensis TaxID=1577687 RepID=UPI00071BC443|nr:carboxylesterase family protein [Terracidiphilus gabretensis]